MFENVTFYIYLVWVFKDLFLIVFTDICWDICVWVQMPMRPEVSDILDLELQTWAPGCGCWEPTLSLLQEEYVLMRAEISLQPHFNVF